MQSLLELATRRMMTRRDDNTYQMAARFMRLAGLAPDYIRLLRSTDNKFILMTNFSFTDLSFGMVCANFEDLMHIVEQLVEWRVRRLEFDNIEFCLDMLDLLENVLPKTKARTVSLINCTFTGFTTGSSETRRLNVALGCGTKGGAILDTGMALYKIISGSSNENIVTTANSVPRNQLMKCTLL